LACQRNGGGAVPANYNSNTILHFQSISQVWLRSFATNPRALPPLLPAQCGVVIVQVVHLFWFQAVSCCLTQTRVSIVCTATLPYQLRFDGTCKGAL
jgi:hypothetical protein